MNKRAQHGIGLVILGVVAIIAVIGLVLLFTRASAEGASIGNIYGGGPGYIPAAYPKNTVQTGKGISYTYQTPAFNPYRPQISYPADVRAMQTLRSTKGTRTPAYVVVGVQGGGYASIEDASGCKTDLHVGSMIMAPGDTFNCYTVPQKTGSPEVTGNFPPASSAESRPLKQTTGKLGGDVYCYANSVGGHPDSERLIRENILRSIRGSGGKLGAHTWTTMTMNGVSVPVCWVSQKKFPFRQGIRS